MDPSTSLPVSNHVCPNLQKQWNQNPIFDQKVGELNNTPLLAFNIFPIPKDPKHNLIGRLIGPGGLTIRQLETKYQCRIRVRGNGSFRNSQEEQILMTMRGFDHLHVPSYVFIIASGNDYTEMNNRLKTVTDFINRLFDSGDSNEFKQHQLETSTRMNKTHHWSRSNKKKRSFVNCSKP